jgi:hypothetical protein
VQGRSQGPQFPLSPPERALHGVKPGKPIPASTKSPWKSGRSGGTRWRRVNFIDIFAEIFENRASNLWKIVYHPNQCVTITNVKQGVTTTQRHCQILELIMNVWINHECDGDYVVLLGRVNFGT